MTPPPSTGRALLRSCAPALLRSCDYSTNRPVPPCQVPRVTFLFGTAQRPHITSGSGSFPAAGWMFASQPGHCLAPAAFTQTGLAAAFSSSPTAASFSLRGGGGSSTFVPGHRGGCQQAEDDVILPGSAANSKQPGGAPGSQPHSHLIRNRGPSCLRLHRRLTTWRAPPRRLALRLDFQTGPLGVAHFQGMGSWAWAWAEFSWACRRGMSRSRAIPRLAFSSR